MLAATCRKISDVNAEEEAEVVVGRRSRLQIVR
jgi:hypothetical protein